MKKGGANLNLYAGGKEPPHVGGGILQQTRKWRIVTR
jgi:hypothetical protein